MSLISLCKVTATQSGIQHELLKPVLVFYFCQSTLNANLQTEAKGGRSNVVNTNSYTLSHLSKCLEFLRFHFTVIPMPWLEYKSKETHIAWAQTQILQKLNSNSYQDLTDSTRPVLVAGWLTGVYSWLIANSFQVLLKKLLFMIPPSLTLLLITLSKSIHKHVLHHLSFRHSHKKS